MTRGSTYRAVQFLGSTSGNWPVAHLCRLLGVPRSDYYDWRDQPGRVISPQELALRRRMKELFRASRDSLGSRTLMKNLREEGFAIGRDRTRRLMKALNLKVRKKRKYKATTDSKHNLPVAENVLHRQFAPQESNQLPVVDRLLCYSLAYDTLRRWLSQSDGNVLTF